MLVVASVGCTSGRRRCGYWLGRCGMVVIAWRERQRAKQGAGRQAGSKPQAPQAVGTLSRLQLQGPPAHARAVEAQQ